MAPRSRTVHKKPPVNKLALTTTSTKKLSGARDKQVRTDGFDSSRFVNPEAQKKFFDEHEITRTIITERGVECTPESFPEFYRLFQQWGWMEFIKQPTEIEGELVREFYANVSQTPDAQEVKVRGRLVKFDKATINTLYELPTYATDQYTTCLAEAIDMKDIVEYICIPGTVVRPTGPILKASLTPTAKIWFAFIACRLMPTTHYTKLSEAKARLIYSLMKEHTVDVGELICKGIIRNATKEGAQTFWFPSLIFRLCMQAGVQRGDGTGVVKLTSAFDDPTWCKILGISYWNPKSARTISNRGWTSSSKSTPKPRTMPQRLDAVEKQLNFLFAYIQTGFQRNEAFQAAELQSRGVQLPPMPPFPTMDDFEKGPADITDDAESSPEDDA